MTQSADRPGFDGTLARRLGVYLARRWHARHPTADSRRVALTRSWEYDVTSDEPYRLLAAPSRLSVAFFSEAGARQLIG